MDYKYIEQLLERYWQAETTLEEENILRTFFSQKDVPAMFLPYRDLFVVQHEDRKEAVLSDDFDERLKEAIGYQQSVKARTLSLTARLRPLFKAAAIVAIVITMGNAIESALQEKDSLQEGIAADINRISEGFSVAQGDSITIDTLRKVTSKPTE